MKGTEKDEWFFRHKPGDPLTFETPGGEITGYGNIDVSFDGASKDRHWLHRQCGQLTGGGGFCTATGNFGWMPDISTNLSYLGVGASSDCRTFMARLRLSARSRLLTFPRRRG